MRIVVSFVVQSGRSPGSPRHHLLLCFLSLTLPIHTSGCCISVEQVSAETEMGAVMVAAAAKSRIAVLLED